MKNSIRHPKRRGEWVEMQFMARAAIHDFTVSKPWGDSARYDFILEHDGGLCRVQVKSTSNRQHNHRNSQGYACAVVSRNKTQPITRYRRGEIDFIAAYVIPQDTWYIVPLGAILHRAAAIYLNPNRAGSKYDRYREAWHLLRTRSARIAQIHACAEQLVSRPERSEGPGVATATT